MGGRRARRRAAAVAVGLTTALLGACADGDVSDRATSGTRPSTTPAPTSGPAPPGPDHAPDTGMPEDWRPTPLDWEGCTVAAGAECATLVVPLDWDAPDGPTVGLAVVRLPAEDRSGRLGTLVVNPGGPGGSGVDLLTGGGPFSAELGRRFDRVGWDPRGVGRSGRLGCGRHVAAFLAEDSSPDDEAEQRRLDTAAAAVAEDCARTEGDVLAHLGTADTARDVEALRRALGEDRISYFGFSYGTHIGQVYADRFPDHVRAMVLDGVVDPAASFTEFLLAQVDGFDAAFERSARRCGQEGRARCGVADLGAAYDEVAAQVETAPLRTDRGPVGPSELAVAATYAGYLTDGWRRLGGALADGLEGRGDGLRSLAEGYYSFGSFPTYVGVVCVDSPPPQGAAEFRAFADGARARSPRFGASIANELLPCATWGAPATGAPEPIDAPGTPPVLVVGSTGDPATPYANAVAVADRLAGGLLLTVDAGGHTSYASNDCARAAIDRYLVDLEVPAAGTRC